MTKPVGPVGRDLTSNRKFIFPSKGLQKPINCLFITTQWTRIDLRVCVMHLVLTRLYMVKRIPVVRANDCN